MLFVLQPTRHGVQIGFQFSNDVNGVTPAVPSAVMVPFSALAGGQTSGFSVVLTVENQEGAYVGAACCFVMWSSNLTGGVSEILANEPLTVVPLPLVGVALEPCCNLTVGVNFTVHLNFSRVTPPVEIHW